MHCLRRRLPLALALALLAGLGACGDEQCESCDASSFADGSEGGLTSLDGDGAGSADASASGDSSQSGDGDGDSGGDSGGDGDGDTPTVPTCQVACQLAADCAQAGPGTAFDEDNYSCEEGVCVYTGCLSDLECDPSQSGTLVCRAQPQGVPLCVVACQDASQCGSPVDTDGPYGSDNYTCEGGGCVYAGCGSNAECATLGSYACESVGDLDVCQLTCGQPGDCALPNAQAPYDGDNYACADGICQYTGCIDDAECQVLGDYVCR